MNVLRNLALLSELDKPGGCINLIMRKKNRLTVDDSLVRLGSDFFDPSFDSDQFGIVRCTMNKGVLCTDTVLDVDRFRQDVFEQLDEFQQPKNSHRSMAFTLKRYLPNDLPIQELPSDLDDSTIGIFCQMMRFEGSRKWAKLSLAFFRGK